MPPPYKHQWLDRIRWILILALWGGVAVMLWQKEWYWAVVWLAPGLVLVINIVGFAMVPIYGALNVRAAERELLEDFKAKRESSVDTE